MRSTQSNSKLQMNNRVCPKSQQSLPGTALRGADLLKGPMERVTKFERALNTWDRESFEQSILVEIACFREREVGELCDPHAAVPKRP